MTPSEALKKMLGNDIGEKAKEAIDEFVMSEIIGNEEVLRSTLLAAKKTREGILSPKDFEKDINLDITNFMDKEKYLDKFRSGVDKFVPIAQEFVKEHIGVDELVGGFFVNDFFYETYKRKYQLVDIDGNPIDEDVFATFSRVAAVTSLSGFISFLIGFFRNNGGYDCDSDKEKVVEKVVELFDEYKDTLYKDFKEFFSVMALGMYSGAGRIMANAGSAKYKPYTSLINCTVMKQIPDSMEGIMDVLKDAAMTLKSGAGVGYNFSSIRPKGAPVQGAGAFTSGVISFMEIFDRMCETIESAGGRRGAQMSVLHISHPEIEDYITYKKNNPGKLLQFNLSVFAPDAFFEAVEKGENWTLWFWQKTDKKLIPDDYRLYKDTVVFLHPLDELREEESLKNVLEVVLIPPDKTPFDYPEFDYFVFDEKHTEVLYGNTTSNTIFMKKVYKTLPAAELYKRIMETTLSMGEPGVLFYDRINEMNPLHKHEHILATNPCGEQPLNASGSCLLGSLFLQRFVIEPFSSKRWQDNYDWEALREATVIANRLMDHVNNITNLPLPSLKYQSFIKRRHGLGFSGIADAMGALGIVYGDNEDSRAFVSSVMSVISSNSTFKVNTELAEKYGNAPIFDDPMVLRDWWNSKYIKSLVSNLLKTIENVPEIKEYVYIPNTEEALKVRYSHATSIAPTGTISLTFGNDVANGIEPVYALVKIRNIIVPGKKTKKAEKVLSFLAFWYKQKTGIDLSKVPAKKWPSWVKTAVYNVSVNDHLTVQSEAQKYVDSAISKTINLPPEFDAENMMETYLKGWKMGLKGMTTFKFNPSFAIGVLSTQEILEDTRIVFTLDSGEQISVSGDSYVEYDGEEHLAANLYEALLSGKYGRYTQS